jgi:hypothetical protein
MLFFVLIVEQVGSSGVWRSRGRDREYDVPLFGRHTSRIHDGGNRKGTSRNADIRRRQQTRDFAGHEKAGEKASKWRKHGFGARLGTQ